MSARVELRPANVGVCLDMDVQRTTDSAECVVHEPDECPLLTLLSQRPHYLRLVAANGQVLATSEMYSNRSNARRAVVGWKRAFADVLDPVGPDKRYVRKVAEFNTEGKRLR